jgi:DNA-binding transcriptional LysR family regulator
LAVRSINLNLVPILQALLKEESVAKAAEEMGLSQPAMSGALARLRLLLDDPILVRVGRSMRLTPRAKRMRGQLDQICVGIERLFEPENFDPATAEHSFVVAAPDYIAFLLSGVLLVRLRKEAPGIRLRFMDVPGDLQDWLENSTIDLAVCGNFDYWPDLKYEHIFRDRVVVAASKGHPLLKRARVSSTDLLEFPSLHYDTSLRSSTWGAKFLTGIPSLDQTSQISASQFTDAVLLAAELPTVARAPASLVKKLGELLPVRTIELWNEETGFDTGIFWSAVHDDAREHKWLRTLIKDCLGHLAEDAKATPQKR